MHSVLVLNDRNPTMFGDGHRGRGGGGVDFRVIWSIFFCFLEKKPTGTFFNTKRIGMSNFSGFRATWKIATKEVHTPLFDGALHFLFGLGQCTFFELGIERVKPHVFPCVCDVSLYKLSCGHVIRRSPVMLRCRSRRLLPRPCGTASPPYRAPVRWP